MNENRVLREDQIFTRGAFEKPEVGESQSLKIFVRVMHRATVFCGIEVYIFDSAP